MITLRGLTKNYQILILRGVARIIQLRFNDRRIQGPYFHLTSVDSRRNRMLERHTHDYPEVFWMTQGQAEHAINDTVDILDVGALVFIRAADRHRLSALDAKGFTFSNLSIAPDLFTDLRQRFGEAIDRFYSDVASLPTVVRLSARELDALQRDTRELGGGAHTRFNIERFLLNLWHRCQGGRVMGAPDASLPDWLSEACLRVQEPEVFGEGVGAFVRVCGRGHEHVARVCRQTLGKTPLQIVNEARLARAANDLRTTSRSVTEIILDCGFQDAGTFFRQFKKVYGTTPRRYRTDF